MSQEVKNITRKLKYTSDSFHGLEWNEFLKNCNINFYTSRKDQIWHSIRGKGFIIWISTFRPSKEKDQTVWLSDIEISKNSPKIAFKTLDEFIQAAIDKFDKMELQSLDN